VASRLLFDVLTDAVDAAVIVSNDSDLRLPAQLARTRVPVGTVNPTRHHFVGALRGLPSDGVGRHWWRQLTPEELRRHQLPNPAGGYTRPAGW
jgi:hypothetical protein